MSDEIRKLKKAATRGILYKFCKIHRQTPVPESFLNKRLCPYTRICVPEKNPFFEMFYAMDPKIGDSNLADNRQNFHIEIFLLCSENI